MSPSRGRIAPELLSPRGAAGGAGRMWLPVVVAPLFALSPIAGCALGGRMRQAVLPTTTPPPAAATLEAPRVTFAEASPPAAGAPSVTIAPTAPGTPARAP